MIYSDPAVWGEWNTWYKFDIERLLVLWRGSHSQTVTTFWPELGKDGVLNMPLGRARTRLQRDSGMIPSSVVVAFMEGQMEAANAYLIRCKAECLRQRRRDQATQAKH